MDDILFGLMYAQSQRNRHKSKHAIPHVIGADGVERKSCSKCARLKPLKEFSPNVGGNAVDNLLSSCKDCKNEYERKRYDSQRKRP